VIRLKKILKEYIFINLGLVLVALGIFYFLVPNNLAVGGVSGLSIIINYYLPQLPVGLIMLVLNIVLLIIGFIFLGAGFGIKTIYSSLALSGMVWVLENIYPLGEPLLEDKLVQLIFGVFITAVGMAIVFNQDASTGGTDIIAKILNKYFHLNIGKALLWVDIFIVALAGMAFGIGVGIYALLGVLMSGFMIDYFIQGFNIAKQVVIISKKSEIIKSFIVNELERGATIYAAKGAFTNEEKEVITTIIGNREFIRLKKFIKEIDPKAFIMVSNMHEILGEGFKDLD
jgi:uncharacterized membrane-anchored protein YitT (DUF2179 family)